MSAISQGELVSPSLLVQWIKRELGGCGSFEVQQVLRKEDLRARMARDLKVDPEEVERRFSLRK